MAISRAINLKRVVIAFDASGNFLSANRTRQAAYTDSTDGSIEPGEERQDQLTLAQVKTLVAGL